MLVDWKRVRELKRDNAYGDKKGLPPFDPLPHTNLHHYWVSRIPRHRAIVSRLALTPAPRLQAQQNIYAEILRRNYGVDVKRMVLLQMHPELDTYQEHYVPAMPNEMEIVWANRKAELAAEMAPAGADDM